MMFRALPAPSGRGVRAADRLLIVGPVVLIASWAILSAWCISILCHLGPLAVAARGALRLSPCEPNGQQSSQSLAPGDRLAASTVTGDRP
jgi:hypothetical protein